VANVSSTHQREAFLRNWAICALLVFSVLVFLPHGFEDRLFVQPSENLLVICLRTILEIAIMVVVPGFYMRMFWECGFSSNVFRRAHWLTLFILLPVFSAFIYFFVTRSQGYKTKHSGYF
jgi:hypothetical protein